MPVIPTVPVLLSPEPGTELSYPWRFRLGDRLYILGRPLTSTYKVVGGELWLGFPHVHVATEDGKTLRVPQLHCSSKPITFRKD